MSRRTLPDELRSVLLAHALQAPDPADTMQRVLAATVAAEQPRPDGWWRRPVNLLAAGAAAVLVLMLVGVGFVVNQAQHSASTANRSNSAGAVRGPAPQQAGSGQAGSGPMGSGPMGSGPMGSGPMGAQTAGGNGTVPQRPYIAPGETVGSPAPPPPAGMDCTRLLPGSRLAVGEATRIRLTTVAHDLYLYDFRCVLAEGQRSASTVAVYALAHGGLRLQAVLVPADANDQADYMGTSDSGGVLAVQLLTAQRTLIRRDFTSSDGVRFTPSTFPVAPACLTSDLTVQVARVDSISSAAGNPYAIQFTKHSPGICVLSGYPTVTGTGGSATPTLRGVAGGWGGDVPPIVQLAQGTTVSAMIEPASQPRCAPGNAVTVTLPDGSSVGVLPASFPLCGAQVHPIVASNRGSY